MKLKLILELHDYYPTLYWITPLAKALKVNRNEGHKYWMFLHPEKFPEMTAFIKDETNYKDLYEKSFTFGYIRIGFLYGDAYMHYDKLKVSKKSLKVAVNLIVNNKPKKISIDNKQQKYIDINLDEFFEYYSGLIENIHMTKILLKEAINSTDIKQLAKSIIVDCSKFLD